MNTAQDTEQPPAGPTQPVVLWKTVFAMEHGGTSHVFEREDQAIAMLGESAGEVHRLLCVRDSSNEQVPIFLTPCDSRVTRIAKALAEGCDGRSFSSADAKWLLRRYEEWKNLDPAAGFSDCRDRAFADFVVGVLQDAI